MYNKWPNHGECTESEIFDKIKDYDYNYYVAYQINGFLSGFANIENLEKIDWRKLLEIRLFSDNSELLVRRTMIGASHLFQWRIANEEGLDDDEYIVRYQALDIDSNYTDKAENGNLKLMTTGGGKYELPIDENMKSVRVISYISYGEDGMAFIYDDRLAGFTAGGEEYV